MGSNILRGICAAFSNMILGAKNGLVWRKDLAPVIHGSPIRTFHHDDEPSEGDLQRRWK